jgi:SpoVK/Ycf46/Vps4 family AAA+-type ATPase
MPSLADVRRVITEYCILPLGSQAVHEKAPHIKSVLICGPRQTGKKMLVHAVCTETGANFFDLSPANIAGRYPGKAGLAMLTHMVFKVARALQPSIVYIGDAEKTWMKKIPKTDKSDPKRLKKDLPKTLKTLKPEDRVLIMGVSKQPFNAEVKGLCGVYHRLILVPRPSYPSRFVIWRRLITKNSGRLTELLDLSSLAKISDGYTAGHINTVCKEVLTERRIAQVIVH